MSIKRHTTYNVLGAALPLLVSLATIPAYLHLVGEARFGILAIAWLFLAYFGLFDLGLGRATAQRIAASEAEGTAVQATIFWTALFTNFVLGVLGAIIALPAAFYYFGTVLNVSDTLRNEMLATAPYLAMALPMATVTGVASGALQGLNRFGILNLISLVGSLLFQLLPLSAAAFWSVSLTIVLPVSLGAQAFTLLLLLIACRSALLRGHPVAFAASELRSLFRFGFWVSVSAFFSPLVTMIDRFIIGATISAAAVSVYTVPFNLGQRLCILSNAVGGALFPKFAVLSRKEALNLARDWEQALGAVMLLVIVIGLFLIGPFLSLWVGADFSSRATPAAGIILVGVWFESISRVPLYALLGQSKPEAIAAIDAVQVVPFAAALYVLIANFGLEGVAAAYVFRSILNYLLLGRVAGTLEAVKTVVPMSAAVLVAALTLSRLTEPLTLFWFAALIMTAGTATAFSWFTAPDSARQQALSMLLKMAGLVSGRNSTARRGKRHEP